MKFYKLSLTIPESREVKVQLPEDFPTGPAEATIMASPIGDLNPQQIQQAMLGIIEELRSFKPTPEEERALDDFGEFRLTAEKTPTPPD